MHPFRRLTLLEELIALLLYGLAIAFTLGPFTVRWYGLLIACGMVIAAVGGCKVMSRAGIDEDDFLTIFMMIVVGAVLGARAYYVIFQWPYYAQNPGVSG